MLPKLWHVDHFRFGMRALDATRCTTLTTKALSQRTRVVHGLSTSLLCRKISCSLVSGQKSRLGRLVLYQGRQPVQRFSVDAGSAVECSSATGLQLWRISGDGSCLFRALAQGHHQLKHEGKSLTIAEEKAAAAQLRQDICSEIEKRKSDIEPFLETDIVEYLAYMSQASTWGGEPELSVSPHCLQRPVEVYMYGATGLQVMSTYEDAKYDNASPVKVLFNGIGHYDLLVIREQMSKL